MSEQEQTTALEQASVGNHAASQPTANRQYPKVISNPRDVAAVVMAQMNMVNAKKDELTIAIKGLSDLTQQLARAYAEHMQVIEQLATRVKALEAKAGTNGVNGEIVGPSAHIA